MNAAMLNAETVAGSFSLIGRGPVKVQALPGLVVQVRSGALAIRRAHDPREYLVRAGHRFVSERAGEMLIEPLGRAELRLEWPDAEDERLSPGLEPLEFPFALARRMELLSAAARLGH